MKLFFIAALIISCCTLSVAQQSTPKTSFTPLSESQLAAYLLSLQPQQNTNQVTRMLVLAPYLPPSLSSSFDSLVHGWCENPGFLSCNPAHFPIEVKIITGVNSVEWFRVPATSKTLALPGGISGLAATVWTLKTMPTKGIWLIMTPKPEDQSIIIGSLLDGSGSSAQQFKGAGIASAMYKQMLIDTIISQAVRWQP